MADPSSFDAFLCGVAGRVGEDYNRQVVDVTAFVEDPIR
jgi:hypothetical protein